MDGTTYVIGAIPHHSFDEFGLIRASRPIISPFVVKEVTVDNPGTNGVIDLTEALTEYPAYNTRTITETYIVRGKPSSWDSKISTINKVLDGYKGDLILDSDPAYYWQGRSYISSIDKQLTYMLITITSKVFPFKYERFHSMSDWEWDSFNFETGIIREYKDIVVNGQLKYVIVGTKMPVTPEFYPSAGSSITVTFNGKNYSLEDAEDNIIIREGINNLLFKGMGVVSVLYRGGIL